MAATAALYRKANASDRPLRLSLDDAAALSELQDVLTATAERLKGITLGRGFTKNKPKPRNQQTGSSGTGRPTSKKSFNKPGGKKKKGGCKC